MKKQNGFTLLEILSMMVIGMMILFFSVKQYQSYRIDADFQQFHYDIDNLFQAMARFHRANCQGSFTSTTPPTPIGGRLFIAAANQRTPPFPPFPISINNDLIAGGFLSNAPAINHVIADSFIVQFNEYTQPRMICTNASNCAANQRQVGTIVNWKIQVAAHMRDPTRTNLYRRILNADCISRVAGAIVTPCAAAPAAGGDYLVFERLASFASPKATSGLEPMSPALQQFQQFYTTNPITNLTSNPNSSQNQYYSCGS